MNCCNYGEIIGKKAAGICWHSDNVRNCFNAGKIIGTEEAAGIMSDYSDSTLKVNNCYNVGILEADSGITYGITDEDKQITNCHALTGNEDATAKQALLNALNTNREDTTTWSEWTIVDGANNGYPIFTWQNVTE